MRFGILAALLAAAIFFLCSGDEESRETEARAAPAAQADDTSEGVSSGTRLVNANWNLKDDAPVYIPPRQRALLSKAEREKAEADGAAFGTGSLLDREALKSAGASGSTFIQIDEDGGAPDGALILE